jgi:Fic family protein
MAVYVHHSKKGPEFVWDLAKIAGSLAQIRYNQGRLCGRLEVPGPDLRGEACRQVFSDDTISFSGAGGERFVVMIREAARQYGTPLTIDRLFRWHSELYPSVEKTIANTKVHFQSSTGEGSESKLTKLIHWVNSATDTDPVIKAAVAQLWLLTIRPFEAGSERLGELVMEGLLAQANQSGERFYSVTGQMRLSSTGPANFINSSTPLEITPWIEWFLGCLSRAIQHANDSVALILQKDQFWQHCAGMNLNARQRLVLKKILDGEESKLTSSRWAALTNTSQDTAGRDINDLVGRGVLKKERAGGRSTSYAIAMMH